MRNHLMTWVKSRRRWLKEYKGKKYAVSCAQLDREPTKDASWQAANEWWKAKQAEIDAEGRPAPAGTIIDRIGAALGVEIPPEFAAQLLALRVRDPQPVRSVKECVKGWQQHLMRQVNARNIDVTRRDAYCRYVKKFVDWIGEDSDVKSVDGRKLEGYWAHLGARLAEGTYSAATAQQALMTAKQMIKWCASEGHLSLPTNIADERLKFRAQVKAIEVFGVEEIQKLFAVEGHERSKLYVLLMLNCGMYQSDVSDLGMSEVDWDRGQITRPRSKNADGIVARYQLWGLTLRLLTRHRAKAGVKNERGADRVLLSERGTALVEYKQRGEKMVRRDLIADAFWDHRKAAEVTKPLKHLRKTGASMLARHPSFKYYHDYYLCHTPNTVSARHYVIPNDAEFFKALSWLERQLFVAG